MNRLGLFLICVFLAACSGGPEESVAADQGPVAADIVGVNGSIYTVNEAMPWAEAIAIRGTDIVYVGDAAGAQEFIGDNTEVADLRGKFVMPGIVSGHEHPLMTAVVASALFIPFPNDEAFILDAVKTHLEESPEGPYWSFGGNREGMIEIYRQDVDAVVSDKPFLMVANTGHGAWLNTKGLETLGLMEPGSEAPVDGFERDEDGVPNGYLSTSAAAMFALTKLGLVRKQDVVDNLADVLADYNSMGLTAVLDAGAAPGTEEAVWTAAAELEERGELSLRISAASMAQRAFHIEGAFAALAKWSPKFQSENFTVKTLKIHGGSPDGYSSPLLEPYSDRPDYSGPVIFSYDVRRDASLKAAELGYNIHTHVIGDKAIREALDAFEEVREAGFSENRLTTGHSSMVHPDDVPRYKQNNVTVNWMMATICIPDELNLSRLGEERLKYWCNFRSVADSGARMSLSADAPTSPLNPMLQMELAILQRDPGTVEQLHDGKGGLTISEAIYAYTLGSAYTLGWDNLIGSLEVGKRADLVVLDQNLLEIDSASIHKTNVLLTMLNGEVVHEEAIDWDAGEEPLVYDILGAYEDD